MMPVIPRSIREVWKQASAVTRVKLLYMRVTLNRFTTIYFFLALANCVVLVAIQSATLVNNTQAVDISRQLINRIDSTRESKLPVFVGDELRLCDGVPGQSNAKCSSIAKYKVKRGTSRASRVKARRILRRDDGEESDSDDEDHHTSVLIGGASSQSSTASISTSPTIGATATVGVPTGIIPSTTLSSTVSTTPSSVSVSQTSSSATTTGSSQATPTPSSTSSQNTSGQSGQAQAANSQSDSVCAGVLVWFHDAAEDDKREDVATMFFQLWTLSMAIVTILNESLPHLAATLAAHVLGTAWAGFRIHSGETLKQRFYGLLEIETCIPEATFIAWWNMRRVHAILIASTSIVSLVGTLYLSAMLYRVYAYQTFSRVGSSPQVHRIYKMVLLLSASLQLAWFFTLASSGIWIDKVTHGTLMDLAEHCKLYLAAFIVVLILSFPWIILGWLAVRKENRRIFLVFGVISLILVGISSAMFSSALYRYIFVSWPFFATITVTAYIFTVATLILGVLCRLNFGKGLVHYLQATETLEGMDFTPVYFPNDTEKATSRFPVQFDGSQDEKGPSSPSDSLQQPELSYKPTPAKHRGPSSIYTNSSGVPLKLSLTPDLFREGGLRKSVASTATSRRSFNGPGLDLDAIDAYSQLPIPPKSISPEVSGRPRSRELTPGSGQVNPPSASESPFTSPFNSSADSLVSRAPSKKGLPSNPKAQNWV